jgi:hypothetical protein
MAMGTPAPARRFGPPRGGNLGWSGALAALEARLNGKLASLQIGAEAMEAMETRLNMRLNGLATGWEWDYR